MKLIVLGLVIWNTTSKTMWIINDVYTGTRAEVDKTNWNFGIIAMTLMGVFYFLFTFYAFHASFSSNKKLYINFWAPDIFLSSQINYLINQQTFNAISCSFKETFWLQLKSKF